MEKCATFIVREFSKQRKLGEDRQSLNQQWIEREYTNRLQSQRPTSVGSLL